MAATARDLSNVASVITLRGVNKWFGQFHVLSDINLDVKEGEKIVICGPSGSGKSTLIRCINRLVEPGAGAIRFGGRNLLNLSPAEMRRARRSIGMIFQEYNLIERLSVIDNVLTGRLGYTGTLRSVYRMFSKGDVGQAIRLLDRVGLVDHLEKRADQLSGGQRQRVGIARAIMQEPEIVLADEPTSSLDPKSSVEIMEILSRLAAERGVPVVVNIHNVALAQRFAARIVGMSGGHVVYDGPPDRLSEADLRGIYGGENWLE